MTTEHPIIIAARAACAALTRALDTERRAADEVEAKGGERRARAMIGFDRQDACAALRRLRASMPDRFRDELGEMASGIEYGYAREKWTLRIMAIAAEATREDER